MLLFLIQLILLHSIYIYIYIHIYYEFCLDYHCKLVLIRRKKFIAVFLSTKLTK